MHRFDRKQRKLRLERIRKGGERIQASQEDQAKLAWLSRAIILTDPLAIISILGVYFLVYHSVLDDGPYAWIWLIVFPSPWVTAGVFAAMRFDRLATAVEDALGLEPTTTWS